MAIIARPFRDLRDLRAIQAAITAAWLTHRPLVGVTAGDVAWWYVSGPPDTDWTQRIRLWERDGAVVAWGWFAGPATLDLFVRPGLADAERRRTVAELAGWLEDRAAWWDATGPHDPPTSPATDLTAYALDHDLAMAADLAAAGFEPAAEPEMSMNHRHLPRATVEPEPVIPPGYVLRHVDGERELEARVDVHRAAFAPSRMTVEKYRRMVALDDYTFERDLVIAAPDGTFAAFTLVWWDPVARVGEFEPVGVHPDHRRLGLGRAVNLAGLRLLRELGAVDAIVFSAIANVASEALYRSDGFEQISTFRPWRRPRTDRTRDGRSRPGSAVRWPPMTTTDREPTETSPATRIERDSMGEMEVPADALYGASTQRAVLNFPISGQAMPRRFLRALALIKLAAAETNAGLGLLDQRVADAIAAAASEVATGRHDREFPIDVYQTGSGTSTNTNMNEVLARLASATLAAGPGDARKVHPNDDVNRCQSSNDVIPSALQLSAAIALDEELIPALVGLQEALAAKADEFWPVVKTGRTHLQDATPIRLGQEFRGFAGQVEEAIRRAQGARDELLSLPLGGTAVGTGINSHPEFAARAVVRLSELTGLSVRETDNHFHAQASLDAVIAAHGAVRTIALGLWKIGSDIRLMGMGPRAGLAELALPETQPGSSIMPGKVNPVIVESLTMVVARVVGNDATVSFAQTGSLLELNVMLPVTAVAMLESITLLAAATSNLRARCIDGLAATERGPALVEQGLMLATALAPEIGYDAAAALAKEAYRSGKTIRELATERGIAPERLDQLLDPAAMTVPGLGGGPAGG